MRDKCTSSESIQSLADLAAYANVATPGGAAAIHPLEPLALILLKSGRPALLSKLKEIGVDRLGDRQSLAGALARAVREGLPKHEDGGFPLDFQVASAAWPSFLKSVILDEKEAALCDLVHVLQKLGGRGTEAPPAPITAAAALASDYCGGRFISVPKALSSTACAALRLAVDESRSIAKDSVDRAAEHQLNLSPDVLQQMIGQAEYARLLAMPGQIDEHVACHPSEHRIECFVRRYSRETRPWIGFHCDRAAATVNVALADDSLHAGGRLLVASQGELNKLERTEGEATCHQSSLLHAVSAVRDGVRYSLIVFFHPAAAAPSPQELT